MSRNPNNCSTCEYIQNPDGGHCYMFRDEPEEVCMQHTGRQNVAFINHIPCRGNLSSLALIVANIANLEPIEDNESQRNLDMAIERFSGVSIVYEADFKEEYPNVIKGARS